jgi:hypothetical protein
MKLYLYDKEKQFLRVIGAVKNNSFPIPAGSINHFLAVLGASPTYF